MLGPLTFEMDLPEYANFPLSASAPFLFLHGGIDHLFGFPYEPMVMDTRTRASYRFPVFSSSLVGSPVVVEFVCMLIGVVGRGYQQRAPSLVAWVHRALRRPHHRLSSLATLGPSSDSHPDIRRSRTIATPV